MWSYIDSVDVQIVSIGVDFGPMHLINLLQLSDTFCSVNKTTHGLSSEKTHSQFPRVVTGVPTTSTSLLASN